MWGIIELHDILRGLPMVIDLSSSLFWLIGVIVAVIILYVAFKYFLHIIGHLIEIFWRGCVVVALIVIAIALLHYFGVI